MLFGISLRNRLLLAFVLVSIIPVLILTRHFYTHVKKVLIQSEFATLLTARESKRQQLESQFSALYNQLSLLGSSPATIEAMNAFGKLQNSQTQSSLKISSESMRDELLSWYRQELEGHLKLSENTPASVHELIPDASNTMELQIAYIARNSYPFPQKFLLSSADLLPEYDPVHREIHGHFLEFRQRFYFRDISLIDTQGNILYSTDKLPTFATNILTGPWAETHLSRCYKNALVRDFAVEDFEPFLPALLESSAFLCKALIQDNRIIGVISVQLNSQILNRILGDNPKWEEEQISGTWKSYIVGGDFRIRSESGTAYEELNPFDSEQTHISAISPPTRMNTDAVRSALRGESGTTILKGQNGKQVLSAYTHVRLGNGLWAVLCEKELNETLKALEVSLDHLWPVLLILLTMVVIFGLLISKSILNPISMITEGMNRILRDEPVEGMSFTANHEAGRMLQAFNRMQEYILNQKNSLSSRIQALSHSESVAHQSERDIQKILQELPYGIQWKNLEGLVLGTNIIHELNFSRHRLPELQTTVRTLESEFLDQGKSSISKVLSLFDNDQNPVHIFCHLKLRLDSGANPVGVLVCLMEITDQVRDQAKDLMESKLRALKDFANGICTELPPITENQRINSLLKKYAFPDVASVQPVNLVEIIEDAIKMHLTGTSIHINMTMNSQIRFVAGNQELLQEAFRTFAKRARQMMPQGGAIKLDLRNDSLQELVILRVIEQAAEPGKAIPDIKSIFDPYSGFGIPECGMALATALAIIRAHGGTMEVESFTNIGTCFEIRLPIHDTIAN